MLESVRWNALGTSVDLMVEDGNLEAARSATTSLLDEVDRTYSRFREDSEVCRLASRPNERVAVSALLAQAIEAAIRAARLTAGAVDPTVGRAMRAVGYDDDFVRVASSGAPLRLRLEPIPGWEAIRYEASSRTVCLRPGVELDLGSTGKALAADLAAEAALEAAAARGVLVSIGGDVAIAGTPPPGGWLVLADDDSRTPADSEGEVIAIAGGAVATSSTTVRRWNRGGVELNHLIDPSTGLPARTPWRTVSVVAATCVDANTAATATIVRGAAGRDWLETTGLAARLVAIDGSIVRTGGWPGPDPRGELPS